MPYIHPLREKTSPDEPPSTLFDWCAFLLLLLGGLNLGLYAVFGIDAVGAVLGTESAAFRILHGLVGAAAIYGLVRTLQRGRPL